FARLLVGAIDREGAGEHALQAEQFEDVGRSFWLRLVGRWHFGFVRHGGQPVKLWVIELAANDAVLPAATAWFAVRAAAPMKSVVAVPLSVRHSPKCDTVPKPDPVAVAYVTALALLSTLGFAVVAAAQVPEPEVIG